MSKRRPAPWVPLSVYYYDDEALIEAGEFAETMFTRMMAYAGRHREWNGRLPRSVVLSRLGLVALESAPESAPETRLEALLESGLVLAQGQHVVIAGWLKWNDAGERVEQSREQDRERKNAVTRSDVEPAPESAPELVPESAPDSGTGSGPVSSAQEEKRLEEKRHLLVARRARFEEFWKIKPTRGGKDNPKTEARKVWDGLVVKTDPELIISSARLWARSREGEEAQYTPQAVKWLRNRRWEDEAEDDGQPSLVIPEPPQDCPGDLIVAWKRAHRNAQANGEQGPSDWHDLRRAS